MILTRTLLAAAAFTMLAALSLPAMAADSYDRAQDSILDAAPAGLAPTTDKLSDVLRRQSQRAGHLPPSVRNSSIEEWAFTDAEVSGSERLVRAGDDYHSRITTGPFVDEYGQLHGKRWHKNVNGNVSPTSDFDERSFRAVRVMDDAVDPKNDVTVQGVTTGTQPSYVLRVKRPGERHPEWVYISTTTGDIVRVEQISNKRRLVSTYDDFRTTDRVTEAWHMHDSDGRSSYDDDWHLTSLTHGSDLPATQFAMPASRPTVEPVTQRAAIQSVFDDGFIILRMVVNGIGYDFELDSGDNRSVIDRDVAEAMHLPTFGQPTSSSTGEPKVYQTTIGDADVGPVHLHDFALSVMGYNYHPRPGVKVVGVLGNDFLANNVVHIDYTNNVIEAIPSQQFAAQKPIDGLLELPFGFDDGVPLVPLQANDTLSKRMILDTGMPFTMLFGSLVERAGISVPSKTHQRALVPFADESSYGTSADAWVATLDDLFFAVADYKQIRVVATTYQYSWSEDDVDGMVGADYLRYFDIYFDYPHDRLFVKPNARFYEIFKKTT